MKVFTLITASMLAAASLSAAVVNLDLSTIKPLHNAKVANNVITVTGLGILEFKPIKFDPKAKYTLTFDYKSVPNNKTAIFYAGFYCYDKNGRQIFHNNVTYVSNTFTTLTKAVKPGDKTVAIKDGSKWRKNTFIAFNAKKDFSDLPNYNVFDIIQKVEKKGNEWILTLSAPLKKAYPAGTAIRNHRPGGYIYTHYTVPTAAWKTSKGSKQGVNKLGHDNMILNFWPGTVTIKPIVLANWQFNKKGNVTQFRNFKLDIAK